MQQRDSVVSEATIIQDMAQRVIDNHGEPNYASEKLLRAFQAAVRALMHDLDTHPRQLIKVIEREIA